MIGNRNFEKVKFMAFLGSDTHREGYIDTTRIIALYCEENSMYRVDSIDRCYYVDKESYDKLVRVVYGVSQN